MDRARNLPIPHKSGYAVFVVYHDEFGYGSFTHYPIEVVEGKVGHVKVFETLRSAQLRATKELNQYQHGHPAYVKRVVVCSIEAPTVGWDGYHYRQRFVRDHDTNWEAYTL